jgi:hypothetical protein
MAETNTLNAVLGEQERPQVAAKGVLGRGRGLLGRLGVPAPAGATLATRLRRGRS